ncbi:Isoflavone reductase family protein-like protein CipA [Venustampulla echinocandica]|uniref:Isoflavone reductase family protein-like protein CipA n=1 Tax=Venustampulla echinocandica TaxID=2656787 RepID=A0A370TZK0_9HELO|nr:Isoflavone reductase family protein-like protein CipA [Venustampulla echinocandica]RDL40951.1 Isoflavone reductase family protein-like protein CipA [Venustampulla echinocandica]
MTTIKNVAIVGASGNLGKRILGSLIDYGKFNVTVVTRESSQASFPASVKVVRANYESVKSVTSAFQGQDAVISAVGVAGFQGQTVLIDSAIAAGVKRFLPSEFGSDTSLPTTAALPVFKDKIATRRYLEDKVTKTPGMTYTYIINGPFFDFGVQSGFLLNWKDGTPKIYDGGNQLFSATTLASVGQAVVGVLSHYEETKNRDVFVHDVVTSQNRILEVAKKAAPEKKWEPINVNLAELENDTKKALAKGDAPLYILFNYILISIFGQGYGGLFKATDNELLGVSVKAEADFEATLKQIFSSGK